MISAPECHVCGTIVERFVAVATERGNLAYVAHCHGKTERIEIDLRTQVLVGAADARPIAFLVKP